jgi:hypothetical protein
VLLDAPGRPDPMTLFTRLQEEGERFTEAAAPLKAAGDLRGLTKLHASAQKRLHALLRPFMPQLAAAELWPLPQDVATVDFDLQQIGGVLMREAAKMPGPRFPIGEGGLRRKVERLARAGAVAVITVRGPRSFLSPEERDADELPELAGGEGLLGEALPVPVVQMKWKSVDRLLGGRKLSKLQAQIDEDRRPHSRAAGRALALSVALEPVNVQVPNVLASLPGGDLAQEIVMIGAHYDHIGVVGPGSAARQRTATRSTRSATARTTTPAARRCCSSWRARGSTAGRGRVARSCSRTSPARSSACSARRRWPTRRPSTSSAWSQ